MCVMFSYTNAMVGNGGPGDLKVKAAYQLGPQYWTAWFLNIFEQLENLNIKKRYMYYDVICNNLRPTKNRQRRYTCRRCASGYSLRRLSVGGRRGTPRYAASTTYADLAARAASMNWSTVGTDGPIIADLRSLMAASMWRASPKTAAPEMARVWCARYSMTCCTTLHHKRKNRRNEAVRPPSVACGPLGALHRGPHRVRCACGSCDTVCGGAGGVRLAWWFWGPRIGRRAAGCGCECMEC